MTPKRRKTVTICLIIIAISMVLMLVSAIVQSIHNGWQSFNTVNMVPFLGCAIVMIIILRGDKKKDDTNKEDANKEDS